MRSKRSFGFMVISLIYGCASIAGILVFMCLWREHILLRLFIADVCATVFVYLAGVVFKNTSVYDPYWSVAPLTIVFGLAFYCRSTGAGAILLLLAILYWGVRLTANWAYTFKNLNTQDWRYDMFKQRHPRSFQIISFLGIHMFPTIIVFLTLIPAVYFMADSALNIVTAAGFIICAGSATLQLIADVQMHRFRKVNTKLLIRTGLWKHARHPNYLGEIMMWWGVYVIMLSSLPHLWALGIGALANTLMFLFVSIPMADKRNKKERTGFDQYKKETRSLIPFRKW